MNIQVMSWNYRSYLKLKRNVNNRNVNKNNNHNNKAGLFLVQNTACMAKTER